MKDILCVLNGTCQCGGMVHSTDPDQTAPLRTDEQFTLSPFCFNPFMPSELFGQVHFLYKWCLVSFYYFHVLWKYLIIIIPLTYEVCGGI